MIVLRGCQLVHPLGEVGAPAGSQFGCERLVEGGMGRESVDQIVDAGPGVGRARLLGEQAVESLRQAPVAFGHGPQPGRDLGLAVDVGLLGEVFGTGHRRADVTNSGAQRVHWIGAGGVAHRRYSRSPVPSALNVPAVLRGALVTLVIATPAVLVIGSLGNGDNGTEQSNWVYLAFIVVVAAYLTGGRIAARLAPDSPFTHGAAAPAAAFVVVQIIAWIASSDGVSVVAAVFNVLLAATIGVVGVGLPSKRGRLDNGGGEPTG